jgi:hypothetical protein
MCKSVRGLHKDISLPHVACRQQEDMQAPETGLSSATSPYRVPATEAVFHPSNGEAQYNLLPPHALNSRLLFVHNITNDWQPTKYSVFQKELQNGIPTVTLWRVLRERLHLKVLNDGYFVRL